MVINPNDKDKKNNWQIAIKLVISIISAISLVVVFSSFFFSDYEDAKTLLFIVIVATLIALGFTVFTGKSKNIREPLLFLLLTLVIVLVLHLTTNIFYVFKNIYNSRIPSSITDIALNILSPSNETEIPQNQFVDLSATPYFSPDRPIYLIENRPDFPILNSITNNSTIGDERDFFRVKRLEDDDTAFSNEISLEVGKHYTGVMYFYNGGKEFSNNASLNTNILVTMPSVIDSKKASFATTTIQSRNSVPQIVSDRILLKNENNRAVVLRYVPDSAKIITNGQLNGTRINFDDLAGSGLNLGFDALDGVLHPGEWYGGYIVFDFMVDQPDFALRLEASPLTTPRSWTPYKLILGENTAEIRINYRNTGTTVQRNVLLKLILPEGFTYVEGSSKLANHNTGWEYEEISDNLSTDTGINIGHYSAGAEAYIKATFEIDPEIYAQREGWTYTIWAFVITENGYKKQALKIPFGNPPP